MSTGGDVEYLTCMGKARVGQHLVRGTSGEGGQIWGGSLPPRPAVSFPVSFLTVSRLSPKGGRMANRRPVRLALWSLSGPPSSLPPRRRLAASPMLVSPHHVSSRLASSHLASRPVTQSQGKRFQPFRSASPPPNARPPKKESRLLAEISVAACAT